VLRAARDRHALRRRRPRRSLPRTLLRRRIPRLQTPRPSVALEASEEKRQEKKLSQRRQGRKGRQGFFTNRSSGRYGTDCGSVPSWAVRQIARSPDRYEGISLKTF